VPIHLHWATGEAIRAALVEGVAARAERARRVGEAVAAALATVGFAHLVAEDVRLPTVLALTLPDGLDDATVRAVLRAEQLVSLAGGLGSTAGRVWRLGLMGEAARPEPYRRLMAALAACCRASAWRPRGVAGGVRGRLVRCRARRRPGRSARGTAPRRRSARGTAPRRRSPQEAGAPAPGGRGGVRPGSGRREAAAAAAR
jgi:hypothetical protein